MLIAIPGRLCTVDGHPANPRPRVTPGIYRGQIEFGDVTSTPRARPDAIDHVARALPMRASLLTCLLLRSGVRTLSRTER
jgi:hypothetical protein